MLPQDYYEASVLQDRVNRPCTVPANGGLCKHFTYVDVSEFPSSKGEEGYTEGDRDRTQLFNNRNICQELGTNNMAYLDIYQVKIRNQKSESRSIYFGMINGDVYVESSHFVIYKAS